MSFDDFAIRVREVSKHYLICDRPEDRLKQMLVPRLERLVGRAPRRYYRDFAALNGVSFDIRRGETVGIIGRNGSGKSTLLQIVCGTLQPTTGTVAVTGRIAALLELGAGFNPEFTGRENVYLNAAILGLGRDEIDARFDSIARFADIGMFIDQPVKTYSSGMYVRLAFATAINVDPDILVVDEALAVGDEAFQRKCFARIEDIRDNGGTILFVSHGAQTIVQLCDRALLIDSGEKILEGRPKMVTNQYQRLVNLSGVEAEAVRDAIKRMDDCDEKPEVSSSPVAVPSKTVGSETEGWFDPELKPETTVHYEATHATIANVRILTPSGRQVNVIKSGLPYRYAYDITARSGAKKVSFGMLFRSVQGAELCGANTERSPQYGIDEIRPGETWSVVFDFVCGLRNGVYFVNAGVVGNVGSERTYLHRLLDAAVVKVLSDDDLGYGYFDLGCSVMIRRVGPVRANIIS